MELEKHNLRIDSTGWERITIDEKIYLENPEKDICELDDGEQLFTWDAAMRETEKAGKRMPTDKEFKKLFKMKRDIPNITFNGYRSVHGHFVYNRSHMWYWSSTESGDDAFTYGIDTNINSDAEPCDHNKSQSFSVRCIKETKKT